MEAPPAFQAEYQGYFCAEREISPVCERVATTQMANRDTEPNGDQLSFNHCRRN
jgi:hypothetical protein